MFGKGGGPLNAWIKEFCELVFIQTLQAFIFAVVVSFVVNLSTANILEEGDRNLSYGIICIVAFTSIFKIEDILRRIFGFGPTKADHGNAVQSIGKSMMALKMGKNLLDNGKKVVGGAGAFFGAHGQRLKAQKRMQSRLDALEKDNNGENDGSAPRMPAGADKNNATVAGTKSGTSSTQPRKIDSTKRDKKIQLFNDAQKARQLAAQEKDESKKKALMAEAKSKLNEAKNIDDTLVESETSGLNGTPPNVNVNTSANVDLTSSSNKGGGRIKDYNQKKLQIQEEYDNKKAEIKKNKRQGLKQMVSGVAESGAALVGFTAGTAMSVASTNDWGGAVKDGIAWAGTADAVTAGAVDMGFGLEEFAANRVKNAGKMVEEYGANVASAYKDYVAEMGNVNDQVNSDTQQQLNDIKDNAERAARNVAYQDKKTTTSKTSSNRRSGPTTKRGAAVRALGKGFTTTAAAHSVNYQEKVIKDTIKRLDMKNSAVRASDIDKNVLK